MANTTKKLIRLFSILALVLAIESPAFADPTDNPTGDGLSASELKAKGDKSADDSWFHTPNYADAAQWYEKAATLGDADAAEDAAELYETGRRGLDADQEKARALYRKAVDLNTANNSINAHANNRLALMELKGEGGPVDLDDAAQLLRAVIAGPQSPETATANDTLAAVQDAQQQKAVADQAAAAASTPAKEAPPQPPPQTTATTSVTAPQAVDSGTPQTANTATPEASDDKSNGLPWPLSWCLNFVMTTTFFGLNFFAVWFAGAALMTLYSRHAIKSAGSEQGRANLWKQRSGKYQFNSDTREYRRIAKVKGADGGVLVELDPRDKRYVKESVELDKRKWPVFFGEYLLLVLGVMWLADIWSLVSEWSAKNPNDQGLFETGGVIGALLVGAMVYGLGRETIFFVWQYTTGREHIVIDPPAPAWTAEPFGPQTATASVADTSAVDLGYRPNE